MRNLALGLVLASALPLHGQRDTVPQVFTLRQVSWWAADGLPAGDIVAHDSTFTFKPDSAAWPVTGTRSVAWGVGTGWDGGSVREGTLIVEPRRGVVAALLSAEAADCGTSWRRTSATALAVIGLQLLTPADPVEDRRPLPRLTLESCGDSVTVTASRTYRNRGRGDGDFAIQRLHVRAAWTIEPHLVDGGVRVHSDLSGHLSGAVVVDSGGVFRRVDLRGRLRGLMVFTDPRGFVDSVYGHWVTELTGGWQEDPDVARERDMDYFLVHGRYPDGPADTTAPSPIEALAFRAGADSAAMDSLLRWRVRTDDPAERMEIDAVLRSWDAPLDRMLEVWAAGRRIAPEWFLESLAYRRQSGPHGAAEATVIRSQLAPRLIQRRRLTDREDMLSDALHLLSGGRGFDRDEGPRFAAAAANADDPLTRDILLFAAYQSDPARYRDTVRATVDSIRGYGPIVLAWLDGSSGVTNWSWGRSAADIEPHQRAFPGFDAPHDVLSDFLVRGTRGGGLAALEMLGTAEGWDPRHRLRARLQASRDDHERLVLARYLAALADTTANPYLRTVIARGDSLAEQAYHLVPPDTVRDTTVVADLYRRAVAYLAGRDTFRDTSGTPIGEPWVHDERPDLRILMADGLPSSVLEAARVHFMVLTLDSIESRVASDGMQMAWHLGEVTRKGERYYFAMSLGPVGGPCLCGGGVRLSLERRDGQWIVVDVMSWIS